MSAMLSLSSMIVCLADGGIERGFVTPLTIG
jgi:hypothetical protein